MSSAELARFRMNFVVDSTDAEIAGLHRGGIGDPVVFLLGFGSTKADFAWGEWSDGEKFVLDQPDLGARCSVTTRRAVAPAPAPTIRSCRSRSSSRSPAKCSQNHALSYLVPLRDNGITVVEIPDCAHFPMSSNPRAMSDKISAFVASADLVRRSASC